MLSENWMRFGKIALTLLIIGSATLGMMIILRPGWGNPLSALGGLLVISCIPACLTVGIIGIILDQRKLLAIITTIVAGGLVLFYMGMMVVSMFFMMRHWKVEEMRFGKISAILLGIVIATICAMRILRPGWGNPLAALAGLLVISCMPASLIVGIIGIVLDRRKLLAIVTTIVSGGLVLFNLLAIIVN